MDNTQAQPDYKIERGPLAKKRGPLAKTYGLFVPSTVNTGAQISADRIDNEGLRGIWFYTANVPLATKRDGKLLLGIGGNAAFNIVFGTNTEDVCNSLINTGYITLNARKRDLILMLEKSGNVVFVDPKDMALKGSDAEYRSFPIRTGSYDKDVTVARLPWISAGYGSGQVLGKVMDNLKRNGQISETTVYTINPEHVTENVEDGEIVARASRLDDFDYISCFYAVVRDVDLDVALRGVPKSAEGGEKNNPLETLVSKGSVAHENIAVVRQGDVSPDAWALLTQKQ